MWKYATLGLLPVLRSLWKRYSPVLEHAVLDQLSRREEERRRNSGHYGRRVTPIRTPLQNRELPPMNEE